MARNNIRREGSRALFATPLKKRWCGRRGSHFVTIAYVYQLVAGTRPGRYLSVRTGSQTPSLKTTTRSSTPHATHGGNSPPSQKRSPPSECATGLTSVIRCDTWYYMRGVDHHPLGIAAPVRQRCENLVEHPQAAPTNKPIVDRLVRTILRRGVAPTKPIPDHKHGIEVSAGSGATGSLRGRERDNGEGRQALHEHKRAFHVHGGYAERKIADVAGGSDCGRGSGHCRCFIVA
jgi:hypothetical protein